MAATTATKHITRGIIRFSSKACYHESGYGCWGSGCGLLRISRACLGQGPCSRRYERFSTLLTSNRPVEDWGKLLGDVAAVSAMLDRLLHHGHVLKCGPRSWRTKATAETGR